VAAEEIGVKSCKQRVCAQNLEKQGVTDVEIGTGWGLEEFLGDDFLE
jgi:hypothetical protein